MKDQNYYNTFIEIAEDCPVSKAEIPQIKGDKKTIPLMQYEMISNNPYKYRQEDILFEVYAKNNSISEDQKDTEREKFFSKGQPCLRSSSLGKRYGWGVHNDENGKVAIFSVESDEYNKLVNNSNVRHLKAMRSKRAKYI